MSHPETEAALEQVLSIMKAHGLSVAQIQAAFGQSPQREEERKSNLVVTLFAYLGGLLIIAGLSVYIGMFWREMNGAERIIITLGSGITALILGLVASNEPRFSKAVMPLFLMAILLQPTGLFVTLDQFFERSHNIRYACLAVWGAMCAQQIVIFIQKERTILLLASIFFGLMFAVTGLDLMGLTYKWICSVLGASLLCLSLYFDKTRFREASPPWYFVGSIMFLSGSFDFLRHGLFEILFLGLCTSILYLSTLVRSRALLIVGSFATIGYIGYFSEEHFVNSVGWPLSLMFFGFCMFGVSAVALKLGRTIRK